MEIQRRIRALIFSIFAVLLIALSISFLGSDKYKSPKHFNLVQLTEGWTVKCASREFVPDDITTLNIGVKNAGDVVVLTRVMNYYTPSPATIHFRSILSTVDVYLDNELIYSFGHDFLERGLMLPKYQHFVPLPEEYAGKKLRIEIMATEDNSFSGLSPIVIGNMEDITRTMSQDGRLPLAIGVFLVTFGLVILILSPLLLYNAYHDLSIAFSGLISVHLGIYILCYNDLFWLFSDRTYLYTYLEYLNLFLIPAGIMFFLATSKYISNARIALILGFINILYSVATSILHFANIVHICHFVNGLHALAIIEGIYLIVYLSYDVYRNHKLSDSFIFGNNSTTALLTGLLLFLTCSVVDIIKYNFLKYGAAGEVNADINFMTVGALFFMISLVLNYFFHCIEYISESNTMNQLEGLAYIDSLTGLANRSKCELTLAELTGNYTIISIDLDYLKYTNDNFGHAEGDRLLSTFAGILTDSFTDSLLIGRMGGDEFIVVLPYVDEERTERDLNCFNDQMKYKNSTEAKLKYSASYGHAGSTDKLLKTGANAQKVYLLADSRMYKMKNQHHQESLGRLYDDLLKDALPKGGKING